MVDPYAKSCVRMQENQFKTRLNTLQINNLEAIMARSFTDDVDTRHGALSATRNHFRQIQSGQRDDAVHCTLACMIPSL